MSVRRKSGDRAPWTENLQGNNFPGNKATPNQAPHSDWAQRISLVLPRPKRVFQEPSGAQNLGTEAGVRKGWKVKSVFLFTPPVPLENG